MGGVKGEARDVEEEKSKVQAFNIIGVIRRSEEDTYCPPSLSIHRQVGELGESQEERKSVSLAWVYLPTYLTYSLSFTKNEVVISRFYAMHAHDCFIT